MLRQTHQSPFPVRNLQFLFLALLIAFAACAPLPAGTPEPSPTPGTTFTVLAHPDGTLYVGDQVSFEVLSPSDFDPAGKSISVSLAGETLDTQVFGSFGVGNRSQATFDWVWDTRALQAGPYTLEFKQLPGGPTWKQVYALRPAAELPAAEANARWQSAASQCCDIYYISGTDSEADLEMLKGQLDAQAADVEQRLGAKFAGKIPFTFLPRTLGHGGFTSDGIYVSYLRQNYAGSSAALVAHHEMVHWLDGQLGGDLRPSIITEGLAVYLSGGHFKPEPTLPRAAALLDLGWYIPLRQLADSFYISQHEIGYAEGAGLVNYLVNTYGWDAFNAMYRDVHPTDSGSQADALDAALQVHFNLTLAQLDKDFSAYLRQQPVDESMRTDLRLTVAFYDTVRRYQREHVRSAFFLHAWLPDVAVMRELGITADFLRHPTTAAARQVETWLISGDASLRAADYTSAETAIRAANLLLDLMGRFER